ncbi:hypothetical protein [Leptospira weilii]|uniref:DegT/DnrJ/EryC1/StrS aminotransferase family protein n=1 Tax=Leptospira weilii str. UI 13098 TaxID=1088542 RepID=M6QP78_9LEPT|nr:hypothetical protein [Leptospira weilii]EMN90677.1 hypothetical protein LEP1GSC108_2428 [Leptospira weilii str. UI 13098]ULH30124.1 hypothetical protein FH586_09900 [Leptospira weilii]
MISYIGGDFDSSSSTAYELDSSLSYELYFPQKINGKYKYYFETGIDSLSQIIIYICDRKNSTPIRLCFPAHYCMETILRLKNKLEDRIPFSVVHYASFEELKIVNNCTNILLLSHFNKYLETANEVIDQYKKVGWVVVEDFVQAPFDISKTAGDYSFNSLRKIADIEVSVCYMPSTHIEASQEQSPYYKIKKEAANIKNSFLKKGNKEIEEVYLNFFKKAELSLWNKEVFLAQEQEVSRLLRINWEEFLLKRIENYTFLESKVRGINQVQLLPGKYMYLIIRAPNRDKLKEYFFSKNIFTAIHWPDSFDAIKLELLSLHIDQRYNKKNMEYMYLLLEKFYNEETFL